MVSVANNRGQYLIWNIEGLLNIDQDDAAELSSIIYDDKAMVLIRSKDDPEVDQDLQIGLFFWHNSEQWILLEPKYLCDALDCSAHCAMAASISLQ